MYQVKDYADYLVSSENEEALEGWPYDKLIESIIENLEMEGLHLSSSTADTNWDEYITESTFSGK